MRTPASVARIPISTLLRKCIFTEKCGIFLRLVARRHRGPRIRFSLRSAFFSTSSRAIYITSFFQFSRPVSTGPGES